MDSRYGTTQEPAMVKEMYRLWRYDGTPKSTLEIRSFGAAQAHGKRFTALVKRHLGIDTEKQHPLAAEVERLRALLVQHGIDPDQ